MKEYINVGEGTHYEKAKAWILAKVDDVLVMPNGKHYTITKKNAKSAVCLDENQCKLTLPIKKILPHGSDAYVASVSLQLQDNLIEQMEAPSKSDIKLDVNNTPDFSQSQCLPLARRIIRSNSCSISPKNDILTYLSNNLSAQDKKLSVADKQTAANIALQHLIGNYPCPMHDDREYAKAEWLKLSTWFYHHPRLELLIKAASDFDQHLKGSITNKAFFNIFGYHRAKSASEKATALKSCLHSWFYSADKRSVTDLEEAYEHLMFRIDSQCEYIEFILKNKKLLTADTPPNEATNLLINSPAQDLLKTILTRVHGLEFGSHSRSELPTFGDLTIGRVTIDDLQEAIRAREERHINQMNLSARNAAKDIAKVATLIEEINSSHLPFVNRKLKEAGLNKITKQTDPKYKTTRLSISCAHRSFLLPACDLDIGVLMAKQYMCVLADNTQNPLLTNDELEEAVETAESKACEFISMIEHSDIAS